MKCCCKMYVILLLMDLSACQISASSNITVLAFINGYHKTFYCVISNDDASALTWITPRLSENPVSRYTNGNANVFCDTNFREVCSNFWLRGQWRSVSSLDFFYGPILDHRWERFEVINTGEYFKVITNRLAYDDFEIAFSIREEKDAHIYLCDGEHPPTANCYWFILDGWDGSRNVLRKCAKYEIPESMQKFPKPPCSVALDDKNDTKGRININEWTHFTLKGKQRTYSLRTLGEQEPFLKYTDPTGNNAFQPNHLIIKSRTGSEGIWKFHLYTFLLTMEQEQIQLGPSFRPLDGTICLAFFAKMCQNCRLNLTLTDSSDNIVHVQHHLNVEWAEIKFVAENLSRGYYKLNVSTESSDLKRFWALDDVRECTKNEVRVVEIIYSGYSYPDYACHSLGLHTFKIDLKDLKHITTSDSTCPQNTFGRRCIPCNSILSEDFCNEGVVCEADEDEKTRCTCTAGYYGNKCQTECPENAYGFGCKQRCGQCYLSRQCNYITGRCDDCKQGSTGHTCKIPRFPVLKYPLVINISHTSMVIQLQDNEYEGQSTPSNYIIQYKQQQQYGVMGKWQNTKEFSANDPNPKVIKGLIRDTKYIVRVLLRPSNDTYHKEVFSKEMEVTTTCAGLAGGDIKIRPTNVSAEVNVKTSPETCPLREFRISVDAKNFHQISEGNFSLTSLLPYTPYNLTVYFNRTNETLAIPFITLEGIPTRVRNLVVSGRTSTEITVTWEPPEVANGNIWCYRVSYAHSRNLGCKDVLKNNQSVGKNTTSERMYTIKGLIPYSTYTIQVEGLTTMEGDPAYISVSTLEEETPDVDELPSLTLNRDLDGYARLVFKQKCENLRGLLTYHAKLCCSNAWCTCMPKILTVTNDANAHIDFRVLAYSDYKLEVKVERTYGNYLNRTLTQNFLTSPAAPHSVRNLTVYSKTKDSASLRWRPPYPPTGILKDYQISYHALSYFYVEKQRTVKGDWCKLWPGCLCATVIIKKYENYDVQFDVRARNELPDEYGPRSSVNGKLTVGKPEPPKNLTAEWDDDYYNLTVSWIHPDVTNGPLTGFTVKINNVLQTTTQEKEQLLYTYTVTNATPSTKITVAVAAKTEAGESPSIQLETYSPPEAPEFSADPYLQEAGNSNLSMIIPAPKNLVQDSVIYIIVTELNTKRPSNSFEISKHIEELADVDEFHFSWIAGELHIDGNADRKILIGSGEMQYSNKLELNVYNRVLKMGTNYIVTFLLSSTYMNKTRSRVKKVQCKTTYQEGSGNEKYSGLFGLLVLPLLCCVGFVLWRKFKKVNCRKTVRPSTMEENLSNLDSGSNYDVVAFEEDSRYYSTVKV